MMAVQVIQDAAQSRQLRPKYRIRGVGMPLPIVDAVLEGFEQTYHHLLHCFPDVRSLVEPVARIEEIQRVQFP